MLDTCCSSALFNREILDASVSDSFPSGISEDYHIISKLIKIFGNLRSTGIVWLVGKFERRKIFLEKICQRCLDILFHTFKFRQCSIISAKEPNTGGVQDSGRNIGQLPVYRRNILGNGTKSYGLPRAALPSRFQQDAVKVAPESLNSCVKNRSRNKVRKKRLVSK